MTTYLQFEPKQMRLCLSSLHWDPLLWKQISSIKTYNKSFSKTVNIFSLLMLEGRVEKTGYMYPENKFLKAFDQPHHPLLYRPVAVVMIQKRMFSIVLCLNCSMVSRESLFASWLTHSEASVRSDNVTCYNDSTW